MTRSNDPGADAGQLEQLERVLGHRFRDRALLVTALTHRSHSYERGGAPTHYERLEFLGDALLGFLVAEWLYHRDPTAAEGALSRKRQTIVRTSTLAQVARKLGLGEAILLGRGEERTGGRGKPTLLADAFEAVLGAVYLDGGVRAARKFARAHVGSLLFEADAIAGDDFKTRLQEAVQARLRRAPAYRIVSTTGPAHATQFEVEVSVKGRVLGRGAGLSRKQAEQSAACAALSALDALLAGELP
jgi:ribonuclease III